MQNEETGTTDRFSGCNLSENLCDNDESCFPDGVFGQCFSEESGSPAPTVLDDLDDTQLELLKLELTRSDSRSVPVLILDFQARSERQRLGR